MPPDDIDRSLLRLAVDNGFLTRDEGMRYWQQLQAPGAPRFVQLLVQSGRLGRPEIERLRALWHQTSGGQAPSGITAALSRTAAQAAIAAPASEPSPPAPAVAVAPAPGPGGPSSGQNLASTDDGSWEEALEKDTQLARVLFSRGLVSQERLRECRAIQLQHRLRLGVVLVRKNYVDRAAVEDAMRAIGSGSGAHAGLPPGSGSGGHPASTPSAPGGLAASTRMAAPPVAPPPMSPGRPGAPTDPFQPSPAYVDQDAMPTLNVPPSFPPGSPFSIPPGATPQDAIPTLLGVSEVSVEELNPFAVMGGAPPAPGAPPGAPLPGMPGPGVPGLPGGNGSLSVDELNAFADVPLGPPPSPGAVGVDGPNATGEDITLPPSWSPGGQAAPPPAEPAPANDLPDSGGERPAAKPKPKPKKAPEPAEKAGTNKALIIFVVVAALIAAAAGLFLVFG